VCLKLSGTYNFLQKYFIRRRRAFLFARLAASALARPRPAKIMIAEPFNRTRDGRRIFYFLRLRKIWVTALPVGKRTRIEKAPPSQQIVLAFNSSFAI
jgi:hypothetical protein